MPKNNFVFCFNVWPGAWTLIFASALESHLSGFLGTVISRETANSTSISELLYSFWNRPQSTWVCHLPRSECLFSGNFFRSCSTAREDTRKEFEHCLKQYNFYLQKLKRRILATYSFNRTTLCATQPNLYSNVLRPVFEDRIFSRRANVIWPSRSCDLIPLDYYLWGAVKDRCYADKSETINALKDNILKAIGEIQLHTIDNVLKIWTDHVGYCVASRGNNLNRRDCR